MKQIFQEHQILATMLHIAGFVTLQSCAHRRFEAKALSAESTQNAAADENSKIPQTSPALMKQIAKQFIADLQLYNDPLKHRFYEYKSLLQPNTEPIPKTYYPYQDQRRAPINVPTESEVYFYEGTASDFTKDARLTTFGDVQNFNPFFDAKTASYRLPVLKEDSVVFNTAKRLFEKLPQVKQLAAQKVYMTSSIRTVLVIPDSENDFPYYLKFDGNWAQPGRTINSATIASAIEKARFIKKQHNIVPESSAISALVSKTLTREFGQQEIHAIYRPFQLAWDTALKAEEGDSLIPFHAFFDVRFYKEHPVGRKIYLGDRFQWQREELAPALANFLVSSLLESAAHFEIHGQNTDILVSSEGKIKRVYQKDLSDTLIDPQLYVLLSGNHFDHTEALASLVGYAYQGFGPLNGGVQLQIAESSGISQQNQKQFAPYNMAIWYAHYLTNYLQNSEKIFGSKETSLEQKISEEVKKIWKSKFADKAYSQKLGLGDQASAIFASAVDRKELHSGLGEKMHQLREFLVMALMNLRGLQVQEEIPDQITRDRCLAVLQSRGALVQVSGRIYRELFGQDPMRPTPAKSINLAQAIKSEEQNSGCTFKLRSAYNHIFGVCSNDPKKLPAAHFFLVDPPATSCLSVAQ